MGELSHDYYTLPTASAPVSDNVFGADKPPEVEAERTQFDSTAVDTKVKLRDAAMQTERDIRSGYARHTAEQRKINCGSARPPVYAPACREWTPPVPWSFAWDSWRGWYIKGSLWVATDDKVPPPTAVHGNLKPQYDAPINAAGQRALIDGHMTALGAKHGYTPGQRPIYSNAAYTDAWDKARAKLGTDSMLVRRRGLDPLIFGEHKIGCLEGTDEGVAACRALKKCHYCSAYFMPNHNKAKFCNDAHRQRYYHNGPMEPRLWCDGLDTGTAPVTVEIIPTHEAVCSSRSSDACTCGMRRTGRIGEFVTISRKSDAKTVSFKPNPEYAEPLAA
jgi:hypothetical protein